MENVEELPISEKIETMLKELDKNDLRYRMLETSMGFRAAWILLAEHLNEVSANRSYKEWGYKSFGAYCMDELQLTKAMASKLLRNYNWLEEQAPQYLPSSEQKSPREFLASPRPVPDADTVHVLARCYKDVEANRLPAQTYSEIKQAALRGERSVTQLRKEIREALPPDEPADPKSETIRHLRRALSEVEKALAFLDDDEHTAEMLANAAQLRDELFELVSRYMGDTEASEQ